MKINEAIEILMEEQKHHHSLSTERISKAILLGIQALKVIKGTREVGSVIISPLLPGETTD